MIIFADFYILHILCQSNHINKNSYIFINHFDNKINEFSKSTKTRITALDTSTFNIFLGRIIVVDKENIVICKNAQNIVEHSYYVKNRMKLSKLKPLHKGTATIVCLDSLIQKHP